MDIVKELCISDKKRNHLKEIREIDYDMTDSKSKLFCKSFHCYEIVLIDLESYYLYVS